MKRKVYLSFLGTGKYLPVHYQYKDMKDVYEATPFIQEATIKIFLKGVGDNTPYKIYIFCTDQAEKKNWNDNVSEEGEQTEGLRTCLLKFIDADHMKMVKIPEGMGEEEIWDLFGEVYDVLEEGDEVTFDMTHSFRSIPLFSMVLFNYARVMKGVDIKNIYYGAFEKLGRYNDVKEMPLEQRIAPIIDLTSIADLQKATLAASDFMKFGKMGSLAAVIRALDRKINVRSLELFDKLIATNQIDRIKEGKWKEEFSQNTAQIRKQHQIPLPQRLLLERMEQELASFSMESSSKNIEAAIDWAFRYGMIQQGYTMIREYTIIRLVEYYEIRKEICNDEQSREFISAILSIKDKDLNEKNFNDYLSEDKWPALRDRLFEDSIIQKCRKDYKVLADRRNELNHGKRCNTTFDKEIRKRWTNGILPILNNLTEKKLTEDKPRLFLNLSNHPLDGWGERQLEAARQYGEIEDLAFPLISEEATESDIVVIVDEYEKKITERASDHELTVHVMGEMTFTAALVSRLIAQGIRCVASTTVRDVIDKGNGQKESTFHFGRFREYRM